VSKADPSGIKLEAKIDAIINHNFRLIREGAIRSTVSGQMRILCTIAIPVMGWEFFI